MKRLFIISAFLMMFYTLYAQTVTDSATVVRSSSKTARRAAVVVSLVVGVMFGSQFNSNWSEILLMFNAQSFGTADPQFGIDNGFYVFVLPGLRLVMSAVSMLLLMGIVFSVVTHAMMGGIRFTMPVHGRGVLAVTKRARRRSASG